ncbi:hypothetical protein, partial [Elizabethkingia anophelis]|uniref:hypothetical protein n=1 Tax=Elizabethkingia anophelis TaxID=1117645 RepID=UPI000DFAF6B0
IPQIQIQILYIERKILLLEDSISPEYLFSDILVFTQITMMKIQSFTNERYLDQGSKNHSDKRSKTLDHQF